MGEPQTLLGVQTFCAHTLATTSDTHLAYPDKVWTCDNCGFTFRHHGGHLIPVVVNG